MKRHSHHDLFKETFSDGELDALREATLQRGLAVQRSKRQTRNQRIGALMAVAALMVMMALFWHQSIPSPSQPTANTHAMAIASIPSLKIYPVPNAADLPPIPTISDKELLALYADRSVGLLGKPGQQKLVFFDHPVNSVN